MYRATARWQIATFDIFEKAVLQTLYSSTNLVLEAAQIATG